MRKAAADVLPIATLTAAIAVPLAPLAPPMAPPAFAGAAAAARGVAPAPAVRQAGPRYGVGKLVPIAWRADPLTITVPGSANLGTAAAGGTISASLGTVTVADSRSGIPPWTATVTATNFTTGSGSPTQTITTANIAYWSGPTTASSGVGSRTPGQPTAVQRVPLTSPVTAFSGRKQAASMSTSWAPTLVVTIPSGTSPGVYTGTITHSVA